MTETTQALAKEESTDGHWGAITAGFLGWTLDAFDFFIVILCVPHIAKSFNVSVPDVQFSIALTLAMRPVGALIFGLLADRYGRRKPLMVNLVFYSAMSICSGLAPNFTIFIICRMLFGIGMGGEWGVGASLAMEKVPPKWRGLLSGLLQEGYATGLLLASGATALIFGRYGWRPLFLIGGLPALLALFVRYGVKESAVWEKTRHGNWSSLGNTILANWKLFVLLTLLMFMMNLSSHGTQDMYPTFLSAEKGFNPKQVSLINALAAVGMICGGVTVGLLSDKIGRRAAMVLSFLLALAVIPLWAFSHSTPVLLLGVFLMQFMVQGAWGVIPAHITELSPDSVRGFLPGFAYQCGVLLAGSIGWIQSLMKARMSYANAMASTAAIVFVCAAIVVMTGREKRGITFGED